MAEVAQHACILLALHRGERSQRRTSSGSTALSYRKYRAKRPQDAGVHRNGLTLE